MPLSKVALMCLESSTYFTSDILDLKCDSPSVINKNNSSRHEFQAIYNDLRGNPEKFFSLLSVSLETFDYILENVSSELKSILSYSKMLTPEEKLFLTLRFLASGMTLKPLANLFQIGPVTASRLIFATLDVIWRKLAPIHLRAPTPPEMSTLAKEYYEKWKFPNCVGAIGGKYVRVHKYNIAVPQKTRYQMKTKLSLVINAVVDAHFRFLAIDVISKRNQETENSFKDIFKDIGMQCLPGTEVMLPLVLIGNEAYPLKSYLMKPYPARAASICDGKNNYNERLKSARLAVDCAFQILTEKWQIYNRPFSLNLARATAVIKVTCLLHNIVKDRDGDSDLHFGKFGQVDNGTIYLNLVSHKSRKNNRSSAIAASIRDQLQTYMKDQTAIYVPEIS